MKIIRYLIHHLFHFFFRLTANNTTHYLTCRAFGASVTLYQKCICIRFMWRSSNSTSLGLLMMANLYYDWLMPMTVASIKIEFKNEDEEGKESIDVAFDPLKLFIFLHCFDYSQQFDTIWSIIQLESTGNLISWLCFIESIIWNTWGLQIFTQYSQSSFSDQMENEEEEKSISRHFGTWFAYELTKFNSNKMYNIKRTILSPSKEVVSFLSESFFCFAFFCFLLFTII